MSDFFSFLDDWPYFSWALGAAAILYLVIDFAVAHMPAERHAQLSRWLRGEHDSTWTAEFCTMFDRIFGARHWGLRCIALSAIASVAAVLGLWLLFDQVLGLISLRADTGLTLTQALLLGAAINILPDWLSLWETRWLLKLFERVRNPLGQMAVLVLDAVVTGTIIWAGIQAYLWGTGKPAISVVEMAAIFSIYAIFFYSTFLTSVWAWAYCVSTWMVRLSRGLKGWLDIDHKPGKSLALIAALFMFAGAYGLKPLVTMDEDGRIPLDNMLCDAFPASACKHLARLTQDEAEQLALLSKACIGGATEECFETAMKLYKVTPEKARPLWSKACVTGDAHGCTNLGILFERGLGGNQDYAEARSLYLLGCLGGIGQSCTNLGALLALARGGEQDLVRARSYFKMGCDVGYSAGCTNYGFALIRGDGGPKDEKAANSLFKSACDEREPKACAALGWSFDKALGVEQDLNKALTFYEKACSLGEAFGCERAEQVKRMPRPRQ